MNIKGLPYNKDAMGGNKKKPVGSQEKGAATGPAGEVKPAKEEKKAGKPQQRQKLAVILEEPAGMKVIQGMKSITNQSVARAAGVKISVANTFLKTLESKGVVRQVGGYSGHKVYERVKQ